MDLGVIDWGNGFGDMNLGMMDLGVMILGQ